MRISSSIDLFVLHLFVCVKPIHVFNGNFMTGNIFSCGAQLPNGPAFTIRIGISVVVVRCTMLVFIIYYYWKSHLEQLSVEYINISIHLYIVWYITFYCIFFLLSLCSFGTWAIKYVYQMEIMFLCLLYLFNIRFNECTHFSNAIQILRRQETNVRSYII